MKYALFMGCTPYGATPELKTSTEAVARKLGIELIELKEATCCGASHLQDFDEFLSLVINARNLCYAEKLGLDMVTLCNTCQLNLSMANERLKSDDKLRAQVNEKLAEVGLEFKGTTRVRHFLYVLIEDFGLDNLSGKVEKPLEELNVAPFYGCHNIRPSDLSGISNGNENPYVPTSLDRVISACGGKNVEYESKNKCCGFHVDLQAPETSHKLTGTALLDAKDNGADLVVTPCPLCHLNFDVQQKNAEKTMGREINTPVLHLPQLVGLALGIDAKDLGIKHHVIKGTVTL